MAARAVQPQKSATITCDVTQQSVQAASVHRADMQPGDHLEGPALIIEPQTTTLVSADFAAQMLADGSLLLQRKDKGEQT